MNTDSYFADDPDLDMTAATMSPVSPSMDTRLGGSMNWMDSDNSRLSYSPAEYLEGPRDYFSIPAHRTPDYAVIGKASNDCMDWFSDPSSFSASPTTGLTYGRNYFGTQELDSFGDSFVSPAAICGDSWPAQDAIAEGARSEDAGFSPPAENAGSGSKSSGRSRSKPSSSTTGKDGKSSSKSKSSKPDSKSTLSSRSKASPSLALPRQATDHGRNHTITLRTASRKPKSAKMTAESAYSQADQDDKDDLPAEERRARQNHNLVEKQYRNRLNTQFERLLAVLPADRQLSETRDKHSLRNGGVSGGDSEDKRMSKAEVLDLARQRISQLEQERRQLQAERKNLLDSVAVMKQAVIQQRAAAAR